MNFSKAILITILILFTGFYLLKPADTFIIKEIVKKELSPNGKYQAIVFIDTGGNATVDFSNNVAIFVC